MTTSTIPRLTAGGFEIATDPDRFGFLRDSTSIADDPAAIRQRIAEDGYLFLPGILDREELQEARRVITDRLAADGLLDPEYPAYDSVANKDARIWFRPDLAQNNPPLERVLYDGAMMEFYERYFGEPVRHYDFTWFRATGPGNNASPHCDVVYMGRGTYDVLTAWTALADIGLEDGVLAILEGSHLRRDELGDYLSRDVDTYCANGPNAQKIESGEMSWEWDGVLDKNAPALCERLGGRWLTTEFRMGDLLTFTMGTVHTSFDNLSNKIRLSSDSRYQRMSEPADERWIGPNPIGHGLAGKRGRIC